MPVPAKRVEHMTPEERLQSLREWAEEQRYVRAGEGGTLPFGIGFRHSTSTQAYTGPVRYVPTQYTAPIAPPSYETAMALGSEGKKPGAIKKWLEKRKEKKRSKSV